MYLFLIVLIVTNLCGTVLCSSNIKPHSHQGILQPYDGKPLPVHLTDEQKIKLDHGDPVRHVVKL